MTILLNRNKPHSFQGTFLTPSLPVKFPGLKDSRRRLKTSTVSSLIASLFSVLCVSMKILSRASAKKKTKRLTGSKFRTLFYSSFSSDIMSVKQLNLKAGRNWIC